MDVVQYVSAEEAVSEIESGEKVYVHGMAAAPTPLLQALAQRKERLQNVQMWHLHIEGDAPHLAEDAAQAFHHYALFVGHNARAAVERGDADYIPVFLSEVPAMLRNAGIDTTLIQVTPPDAHGMCSLGPSVEATLAAVRSSRRVIALVNPLLPRSHGDGFVHEREITYAVRSEFPLHEVNPCEPGPVEQEIGRQVAALVEDGATLQMGIGAIPNATLAQLRQHRNIGVHTEMFSDGLVDLVESGIVTNRNKVIDSGLTVATFLDDNPAVALRGCDYVNDPHLIRSNPKVTAINSAIEVDITGQVCADSIGTRMFSGVGGQMDFMRAAALSDGGKPIISLPSRTSKGEPRIVTTLRPGAGVVTTRAHVHYVVTEFGTAYLYGKALRDRARALIAIAHPDDRERLAKEACQRFNRLVC
jgi:4-hydroxybutyrate CoA-transferase